MNKEKNTVLEFENNNKTEQLKGLLEKLSSLSNDETNVIRAIIDLTRTKQTEANYHCMQCGTERMESIDGKTFVCRKCNRSVEL